MKPKLILSALLCLLFACEKEEVAPPLPHADKIGIYKVEEKILYRANGWGSANDTTSFEQKTSYISVNPSATHDDCVAISYTYHQGFFYNSDGFLGDWCTSERENSICITWGDMMRDHEQRSRCLRDGAIEWKYILHNIYFSDLPTVEKSVVGRKVTLQEYVWPDERIPN